ncbi:hypothetical protein C8Q79DRAFT_927300 [Trametes meyenii]|nr:hypothetical protein C8Q79DRAFT_927300 [Trametes meyenii]
MRKLLYGVEAWYVRLWWNVFAHEILPALEGLTKCIVQKLYLAWNIKVTILEPKYLHSDINDKVKRSLPHPAYTDPASPVSRLRVGWDTFMPEGDPEKAIFYRVAEIPDPPLPLPIGKDAIAMTRMMEELGNAIEIYESWSGDTDLAA